MSNHSMYCIGVKLFQFLANDCHNFFYFLPLVSLVMPTIGEDKGGKDGSNTCGGNLARMSAIMEAVTCDLLQTNT